ncbi:MAG: hypothetical protein AABX11_04415 [Nanoarchaeota archaeon]
MEEKTERRKKNMPNFLAGYKTKTKRPVSFRTGEGRVSFNARRSSQRRKRVSF